MIPRERDRFQIFFNVLLMYVLLMFFQFLASDPFGHGNTAILSPEGKLTKFMWLGGSTAAARSMYGHTPNAAMCGKPQIFRCAALVRKG